MLKRMRTFIGGALFGAILSAGLGFLFNQKRFRQRWQHALDKSSTTAEARRTELHRRLLSLTSIPEDNQTTNDKQNLPS